MAGVIPLERLHRFELVLWRSCHAKVFIKYTPIMTPLEDPTTVSIPCTYYIFEWYYLCREPWCRKMFLCCSSKVNSLGHELEKYVTGESDTCATNIIISNT